MKYQEKKFTRAQLLKAAGAGAALTMLPGAAEAAGSAPSSTYPFFPQTASRYTTEQPEDISRILHTTEHTAAGVMYVALKSTTLNLQGNPSLLATVQAALVEHQRHAELMDSIFNANSLRGAKWFVNVNARPQGYGPASNPVTPTMPNALLADMASFFSGMEWLEALMVGMYTAAVREYAELGQPEIAKWMAQILGVEGGLIAASRGAQALAGVTSAASPNNKAYETDYLLYVRDAVPALIAKGFFNGSGTVLPIFSAAAARTAAFLDVAGPMATTVVQQTPNNATTSDTGSVPGPRS